MSVFKVRQVPYLDGTVNELDLNQVPALAPNNRPWAIRAIRLRFNLVLSSALVSNAILSQDFCALLRTLEFRDCTGKPFATDNPISGRALRSIVTQLYGRPYIDPTGINANTNATNTRQFTIVIPFRMPRMRAPDDHLPLAAFLKGGTIRLGWAPSNLFGTGQTIQSTTSCDVLLDLVPARKIKCGPTLMYGTKTPDTFDRYMIPFSAKIQALQLLKPQDSNAVFSATDFTEYYLQGAQMEQNVQSIENPILEYNQNYLTDSAAALPLVSSGSCPFIPFYQPPYDESIANVPTEAQPVVTLYSSSYPGLSTVAFGYCISRPKNYADFAELVGKSEQLGYTREGVLQSLRQYHQTIGDNGSVVDSDVAAAPWIPTPLNLLAARQAS